MKYFLNINQVAYRSNKEFDILDSTDACIMECIAGFASRESCERIYLNGYTYYWVSTSSILKDYEMCTIRTKNGIRRRVKKLEEVGLIELHPNNKSMGRSYYRITKKYEQIAYKEEGAKNEQAYNKYDKGHTISMTSPCHIDDKDYYTNTSNTNTIIESKENLAKAKPLTSKEKVLACKNREEEFITSVNAFNQYPEELLDEFINYWTERTPSGFKMNWETKRTFEIKKRLITWSNNQKKFDRGGAKFERKPKLEQYHNDPSLDNFDVNEKIAEYNRTHTDQIKM